MYGMFKLDGGFGLSVAAQPLSPTPQLCVYFQLQFMDLVSITLVKYYQIL